MQYVDNYKNYLNEIPGTIINAKLSGKQPFFGYTSDLDVLLEWDLDNFNRISDSYPDVIPYADSSSVIASVADFVGILGYYAINGFGGECDIVSESVCDFLEESFTSSYSLGGTCAQGAAALAAIGVPLTAYVTDNSRLVMEFLNSENIRFIKNGNIVDANEFGDDIDPVKHFILQFNKGEVLRIGGKEYVIPRSNRLIMDYDSIHKYMPVSKDFLQYCQEQAACMTSYNISGFNGIISLETIKERLDELTVHYKIVKENNPDLIIYLESAHYLNPEVKDYLFSRSNEFVSFIGFNEEELADLAKMAGVSLDLENIESVIAAIDTVKNKYSVPGVVMHTKDYSMYYGERYAGIDFERGLTMGNLMSGTRARTGRYGSFDDCKDSLDIPLSEVGLEFYHRLSTIDSEQYCCLVPSRYMDRPNCTIGLGDTFVAGMQIGFI